VNPSSHTEQVCATGDWCVAILSRLSSGEPGRQHRRGDEQTHDGLQQQGRAEEAAQEFAIAERLSTRGDE